MANARGICISAKELSKGVVRRFNESLELGVVVKESLPDDDENFGNEGIALMLGSELRGLYTYKAFASLQAGTTLYYPYGGMLVEDRFTSRHQALIESLMRQLKSDENARVIISLDQQPIDAVNNNAEEESFWLDRGFSLLDVQVFYQGIVKPDDSQKKIDFSVCEYAGGDHAKNLELCNLYRKAYGRRAGIPDVTPKSINEQLSIPGCSYLVMRHKDELIGQVTLFISKQECYVDSIYVKRTYWGTGAADTLTQSLFDYAKTKGCQTLSGAAASNNQASRALMERFGLIAQHRIKRMTISL
jgi:GNAT superfamily N-acetyltransferase